MENNEVEKRILDLERIIKSSDEINKNLADRLGSAEVRIKDLLGMVDKLKSKVRTTTDDATSVINTNICGLYELSAIASATTFTLTGTPTDGQKLIVRFKDAGTTKGLTWTGFTPIGVTLPTDTTAGKWHIVSCIYNSVVSQWQVIMVTEEA